MRAVESFDLRPAGFEETVVDVLARPGADADRLEAGVERLDRLVSDAREMYAEPTGKKD